MKVYDLNGVEHEKHWSVDANECVERLGWSLKPKELAVNIVSNSDASIEAMTNPVDTEVGPGAEVNVIVQPETKKRKYTKKESQ